MQGRCPWSECRLQYVLRARCGRVRRCKRGCHCWQIKHGSDCLALATSLYSSGDSYCGDLLATDDMVATLGGRLSRLSFQTPRMGSPRLRKTRRENYGDFSMHG